MNKKEIFRKFFHLAFLGIIPLMQIFSLRIIQAILVSFGAFYYILEQLRLRNIKVPLFSKISEYSIREKEKSSIAFAPLTLALGILLVLELYAYPAVLASIIAVTIGDSAAALVGQALPKYKLFWNKKKTFMGSAANFLSVFISLVYFLGPVRALIAGLTSSLVESLELEHVDNLMVPLSVGASLYLLNI